MTRLRDMATAYRTLGWWKLTKRIWEEITEDNLFTWASAIAYTSLFAIFPFFLILLSLLPYLPSGIKTSAKHQIAVGIYNALPKDASDMIWVNLNPRIDKLLNNPPRGFFSVGIVLSLWAASSGIAAIMSALDICYDVKKLRAYYKQRALAIGLTLIVAALILLLLILLPVGTIATKWVENAFARGLLQQHFAFMKNWDMEKVVPFLYVWQVVRYLLALLLAFAIVATIYHFGPNVKRRFRFLSPGSVFCIGVWIVMAIGFRLYINKFGKYNETYGTLGGVVILLFFFYLAAAVLLIGGEINSEVDKIKKGDIAMPRHDHTHLPTLNPPEPQPDSPHQTESQNNGDDAS